jgi:DNA-binding transcriptional LysR family regulator
VEFRQLQCFVAVAEELHFARAAARLHVAQPWLSQVIKQVEREVGAALFERTTRQVSLTDGGAAFLVHARRALASLDDAGEAARRAAAGHAGVLAVGFTGASTHTLLPAIARAHRSAYPLVQLDLVGPAFTREQIEGLLSGRIGAGLIRAVPSVLSQAPEIRVAVLDDDPLCALLPDGHPAAGQEEVDVASLRDDRFVAFPASRGAAMNDLLAAVCMQAGFVPKVALEVADSSVLVATVAAGSGVALLPRSFGALQRDVVVRPLTTRHDVPIALAWLADGPPATVAPLVALACDVAARLGFSGPAGDAAPPGPRP